MKKLIITLKTPLPVKPIATVRVIVSVATKTIAGCKRIRQKRRKRNRHRMINQIRNKKTGRQTYDTQQTPCDM